MISILKRKKFLNLFFLLSIQHFTFSQSVGIGTDSPQSEIAILHIEVPDSANKPQGMILPRLTTAQIERIPVSTNSIDPNGLLVFDIDQNVIKYFDANKGTWRTLDTEASYWTKNTDDNIYFENAIGIGNTDPQHELDVTGTAQFKNIIIKDGASNGYVLISDANGVATWKENIEQLWTKNTNNDIYFANNIGIATDDPNYKLDVNGTAQFKNIIITEDAVNGYVLTSDASGNASWKENIKLLWNKNTDDNIYFENAIGIGNTDPQHELDVTGTAQFKNIIITEDAVNGYVLTSDASGNASWKENIKLLWNKNTDDNIYFENAIGIGNTDPQHELDVTGTAQFKNIIITEDAVNGYVLTSDASGNASWKANVEQLWAKNTNNDIYFTNNVGIATDDPNYKLDVNGTAQFKNIIITEDAVNGYVLTSDASGNASWKAPITPDDLGNHTATDDLNMKQNQILDVESIEVDQINKNGETFNHLPYAYANVIQPSTYVGEIRDNELSMKSDNFVIYDILNNNNTATTGRFEMILKDESGNEITDLEKSQITLLLSPYSYSEVSSAGITTYFPSLCNYYVDENESKIVILTYIYSSSGVMIPHDLDFSFRLWYQP